MRTEDFDFALPKNLIAQVPLKKRDACRLLVLDRRTGATKDRIFSDLADLLRPGDLLVFNDTRVLPARLLCRKPSGGKVEILFLEPINRHTWKALAKPGRRVQPEAILLVGEGPDPVRMRVERVEEGGERIIRLERDGDNRSLAEIIERFGAVPLPPYIRRAATAEDREFYQTVYARDAGAVAAPTAGLHFTPGLLDDLHRRGVESVFLTLHVGMGTFLPVKVSDPREHPMHEEAYTLPAKSAEAVMRTKRTGGRVIAVGTTVVRVLEHCASGAGELAGSSGRTSLKILPSYTFKIVDGLITNFHLPRSTLLMLVAAFAGRENILKAYAAAVAQRYRFFSYGDAMFIS